MIIRHRESKNPVGLNIFGSGGCIHADRNWLDASLNVLNAFGDQARGLGRFGGFYRGLRGYSGKGLARRKRSEREINSRIANCTQGIHPGTATLLAIYRNSPTHKHSNTNICVSIENQEVSWLALHPNVIGKYVGELYEKIFSLMLSLFEF